MTVPPYAPQGVDGRLPVEDTPGQTFSVLAEIASSLAACDRDQALDRLGLSLSALRSLIAGLPDRSLSVLASCLSDDELSAVKWLWMRRAGAGET